MRVSFGVFITTGSANCSGFNERAVLCYAMLCYIRLG